MFIAKEKKIHRCNLVLDLTKLVTSGTQCRYVCHNIIVKYKYQYQYQYHCAKYNCDRRIRGNQASFFYIFFF